MITKRYGWVIQDKKTKKYAGENETFWGGDCTEDSIDMAHIYNSRSKARCVKRPYETVNKVAITITIERQ